MQDGERTVTVRRVGDTQFVAALYHTVPGAHPDAIAIDALGEVMTVEPAGRLYKALVETKKATAVEAWNFALRRPGQHHLLGAGADRRFARPPRATRCSPRSRACATKPITEAEVDRVRAKALRQFDETFNDPQQLGVAISESIALGDWRLFFLQRDRWRKRDRRRRAARGARRTSSRANRTLGQFIPDAKPDRAPAPPAVDVAAMVKDYKGDASVAAGEAFEPTPANLEARTQRFTLPNGMKVALLPKKTRGETVQVQLRLHHGDESVAQGHGAARQPRRRDAGARHDRSATGRRSRTRSTSCARSSRIGGSETETVGARPDRARRSCRTSLRLAAEALREPAFPAAEFEKLKREQHRRRSRSSAPIRRASPSARSQRWNNPYPPRATSATCRRSTRSSPRSSAATLEQVKRVLRALRRRRQRRARDRRRLRSRRDARARHRAVRRLEEPGALRARAEPLPRRPRPRCSRRETPDKANAHADRPPAAADQRPQRRTARRCSSPTGSSARRPSRGSPTACARRRA